MEINNQNEWRVSRSGFSIRTGWGGEMKMIAKYPGVTHPLDEREFQEWLDNAETICAMHNAALTELKA